MCSINLTIKDGSFVGIVGKVGSGKSTLLAAILGETEKISGNVAIKVMIAISSQFLPYIPSLLPQFYKSQPKSTQVVGANIYSSSPSRFFGSYL